MPEITWPDRTDSEGAGDINNTTHAVAELFNTLKAGVNDLYDIKIEFKGVVSNQGDILDTSRGKLYLITDVGEWRLYEASGYSSWNVTEENFTTALKEKVDDIPQGDLVLKRDVSIQTGTFTKYLDGITVESTSFDESSFLNVGATFATTGEIPVLNSATGKFIPGSLLMSDIAPKFKSITDASILRVLTLTDPWKYIRFTNDVTGTSCVIPANSTVPYPLDTEIRFIQAGLADLTFSGDSGVTVNSRGGLLGSLGQYSHFSIKKVGTDEWDLTGDIN